jgi:predicted DNA-binding transcriptional regulator AlpA
MVGRARYVSASRRAELGCSTIPAKSAQFRALECARLQEYRAMSAKPDTVYLKTRQVQRRYGVSHMFIARHLANDPTFPRPVFLGRLRFWRLADLEAWEVAQADRKPKHRAA